MNRSNLTRSREPGTLSRIGGAAQGGSAKPPEEREKLDREHGLEEEGTGSAAEDTGRPDSVGGNSNDNRSDEERVKGGKDRG